jgi:cold shock CspA family protein
LTPSNAGSVRAGAGGGLVRPILSGVPRLGRIVSYDADRGLGTLIESDRGDDPSAPLRAFHCTAIADGSRRIDPGTRVAFVLAAGLAGVLEAREVTSLEAGALGAPAGTESSS